MLVKDVSFDVFPGEVFGFLGPNGAGKTTTIRMLVGLIRPTSGRILIDGHNVRTHANLALKRVGCIVENPDLYPYLTGYENLKQLARMQGDGAIDRIEAVVQRVDLSNRLHEAVKTYSLGMRQRLGIAQALLCDPKLLILDEPTNGLDPAGIRELRAFLRNLAGMGIGILVSSHLLSEVEQLCDSVAMLRDGSIVQSGKIEALLQSSTCEVEWSVNPVALGQEILRHHGQVVTVGEAMILTKMDSSAIPPAITALVTKGIKVAGVVQRRRTLEDVFLETTGGTSVDDAFLPNHQ